MNLSSTIIWPKCLAKVGWLDFLVGFFHLQLDPFLTSSSGEQLSNLVVSRKRKAWEGLHAGGSKGGPGRREEEEQEEGEEEKEEEEGGGSGEEGGSNSRAWEEEEQEHNQAHFTHPRPSHHHLLSPLNTNFVHEEVDDDNERKMTYHDFLLRTSMQTTLQLILTALSRGSALTSTPQTTPCLRPC